VGYRPAVAAPRPQHPVVPVTPEEVEREELVFEAEAVQASGRTRRQIIRIVVLLTLVLLSLYVLGPGLVEVFSSAPRLATIGWWWFPLMLGLELASFACLWAVQWISIHRARWWEVINSQLAANAFGRIVPGGGAAAGALQYKLLTESGTPRASTATGLTAANLLTFGVLLGLPALAVPAILDGAVDDATQAVLLWALMILLALVAGGIVLVVTDRPLRWIGDRAQRIRNRLRASRPPLRGLPERLVAERDLIVSVVGERWKRALAASLGRWLLDFAVLAVAVEAVGADPSLPLLLLAYFTAQLLAQIPITPGGLGFVEAGLTGTLAIAGVAGGDAVLATLAYRLFSYWLPIPFGGVSWVLFRRRHPAAGPAPAAAPAAADA
jgi:uncharacterized protein (TIRG00374 family)